MPKNTIYNLQTNISRYRLHLPPAVHFVLPKRAQRTSIGIYKTICHTEALIKEREEREGLDRERERGERPPAAVAP